MLTVALATGLLLGCQPERPAQRAAPATAAPALADSLPYDSLAQPVGAAPNRTWHRLTHATNRRAPLIVYRSSRPSLPDAPPPAEARLQDLTLKASEYFQIDPTKAAEVRGREGTIVRIPAGALVDKRQRLVTTAVWVELKECYSASDLLLSNLLTESLTGAPLELDGAVLVRATAGGQQLALAAGRALQLELAGAPSALPLLYGQANGPDPVRWQQAEAQPLPDAQVLTTAQQMPRYGQGPADINRLIRYPRAAQENHTEGLVFASFVVDEAGRVTQPHILRGLGNGCDEEVLRVLRQTSGHWVPGQQDGRFVKVKLTLPIRFHFQPGLATAPETAAVADATPMEEPVLNDLADSPGALQASRLGWLAAGRSWQSAAASLFVPTQAAEGPCMVRLLVPGHRIVLSAQLEVGGYQFPVAPAGATVVGLRYENGTPFMARLTTTAADTLRFRETTLADLETTLEKFN
ncbi:energy transducer TonB [Hymenobacter pini]|uniref:energy transducer TonB n=1 Tax=Hymenobacter pini TaxID=2880879 RepID=UPI001CF21FE8|nr:energy transducer TonB [Hymenobacter pini]MCA8832434.1 energy transducer TonB [Hymenobacter pini]